MEVATDEPNTPIKQDTKKGKLRDYPCAPKRAQTHANARTLHACGCAATLAWRLLRRACALCAPAHATV
jgi:hypothetical protein